ncbi:permease prefix domain 1-containing protein, partial [Mesorhizobium japonicum]|uniref:permease prefix domain 1-containing protein n=1 Tax=Mesorhizobium japonicum TaxID=2066070 RepID=UPI003B5CFF88
MSEQQLAEWRRAVRSSGAVDDADAAELEDHLRDSIAELRQAGLDDEEAFLIAVRRLGGVDAH